MKFQVGKCYRHTTGCELHILAKVNTTIYGETLLAETNGGHEFIAVGSDEASAENYHEIPKRVWMRNFDEERRKYGLTFDVKGMIVPQECLLKNVVNSKYGNASKIDGGGVTQTVPEYNGEENVVDSSPNQLYPEMEDEFSRHSWAAREIRLAKENEKNDRENNGQEPDPFEGYADACYDSALKAFYSLCQDGHSGMSISITKNILVRLLNGQCLTPIIDTPDIWSDVIDKDDDYICYQCKRMSSLFKYVYTDGSIKYKDVDMCYCVGDSGVTYHSSLVNNLMEKMYPITMPYYPGKAIEVHSEDFLTDHANGDFDTVGVLYAIKNGERVEINRFFKEGPDDWIEIPKDEYEHRRIMAENLKYCDDIWKNKNNSR